jgi:hypothetical protein
MKRRRIVNARLIRTGLRAVAVLSLILTGLRLEPAAAADRVIDLDIGGGSQRLLFAGPPQPRAAIVMLPGGSGDIGLERTGASVTGTISWCAPAICGRRWVSLC